MRNIGVLSLLVLVATHAIGSTDITSSCQILFNNDKAKDMALIVAGTDGSNLFVLLPKGGRVEKILAFEKTENMVLSCERGNEISETLAGKDGKGGKDDKEKKKHKTNGAYLKLKQPEGASVAIFMLNNELKKVWLED